MVDPSDLIQDISEPFPFALYHAALVDSELGIHMIRLDAKPERTAARPAIQLEAPPPICLQARPQPELAQPPQLQPLLARQLANPSATLLELAARVPLVINLTQDTHRVHYDYAAEMCVDVT